MAKQKRRTKRRINKKPPFKWIRAVFVVLLLALAVMGGISYYYWQKNRLLTEQAEETHYNSFGIYITQGYTIHGIDVSLYQQNIYWPSVKAMKQDSVQIDFAFIKATEGLQGTDPKFERNWPATKEQNIIRGAYHYFIATKDGTKQARNFISQVQLEKGDLPPVVDIEHLHGINPLLVRQRLKDCLQALEAYYHTKPIIYSYADFYTKNLGNEFNGYPLWVAHYYAPDKPAIQRPWSFWQHNDKGKISGITSNVDFDIFNGDSTAFKNMLMK